MVFCDLGIGIPATLPMKQPGLFRRLLSMGRATSDSACIQGAVEQSRSSTGLPGRGHGLGNIVNVVASTQSGIVSVMSNRGRYSIDGGKIRVQDFKGSILGTLIYWRVPLDGVSNDAKSN